MFRFLLLGLFLFVSGQVNAQELAPHYAVYSFSLASATSGSGIIGVSGNMEYRITETCDAWLVENNIRMDMTHNTKGTSRRDWNFSSWETKEALSYRYNVKSVVNDVLVEKIVGKATLGEKDKSGVAEFKAPAKKTEKLPAETMFPALHSIEIVRQAQAGNKMFSRKVFDGSSVDALYDVNAVIGTEIKDVKPEMPDNELLKTPSWPVNLAFFPATSKKNSPSFEVNFRYHSNGVTESVTQDFGNFKVDAALEKLEILKKPDC